MYASQYCWPRTPRDVDALSFLNYKLCSYPKRIAEVIELVGSESRAFCISTPAELNRNSDSNLRSSLKRLSCDLSRGKKKLEQKIQAWGLLSALGSSVKRRAILKIEKLYWIKRVVAKNAARDGISSAALSRVHVEEFLRKRRFFERSITKMR